ncbi:MAG TPA: alpha/beta fold hydrolase [Acidimicrobiales bacterium]|nr:alpha/beta fold hydrolase [Acidimicrobiales bacterium]
MEQPTHSRVTSFDGAELAVATWGDPHADVPVLLHHGFAADHASNWVGPGVVARLRALGRPVVAHDARGHGASATPHDPAAYEGRAMARDVTALIDALGVEQVDLAGYSMGGIVSLEVATREARLRSVVIGGIGGAILDRSLDRSALADALVADDPDTITDPMARAFRLFAESTGADRHALAAVQRARREPWEGLDRIAVPALVLVGDRDPLARDPERLVAAVPGARLAVVPGDHLSTVGHPAFADELVGFLAEVAAG